MIKQSAVSVVLVLLALVWWAKGGFGGLFEGFSSNPATQIQLAASSGYYPFWQINGFQYRYPYYHYQMPYYAYHPSYSKHYDFVSYPKPRGYYKYI